ncbi:MAG TPA: hypothetical protein DIS78_09645 [Lachnospiraceae bacterium]|nr:hypothetical protein [Lachnospiraceae bacterium]
MHEIVDKLLNGVFDYDNGKLSFSVQRIEETIPVGGMYEGSFTIESMDDLPASGNVFTSSMRLVCRIDSFEAKSIDVTFLFDSTGLEPGDIIKGDVQIVSNKGEYYIPFAFSIVRSIVKSSMGSVKNLFHFTNQAQMSWEEAVSLFYSREFLQVFEGNEKAQLIKYRGFANQPGNEEAVDDFLISVNKKQPVTYSVDKNVHEFTDVTESLRCELPVRKSTWGYVHLKVTTDCRFLRIEKDELTANDFLGNVHRFVFFVEEDKLHEGRNFGRLIFTSPHQTLTVTIIVSKRMSNEGLRIERREKRNLTMRLMRCYIAFRTKHINVNTWVRDSLKIVERLNVLDEKNPESRLFQAQLLLVSQRFNEAKWIIDHVANDLKIQRKEPTLYSYYLYLTTLYLRDEEYINEVAAEVEDMYKRNRNDYRILWTLMYLDEDLSSNHSQKIELIEEQYKNGCRSPIMYVEAYQYYVNNPVTLSRLNEFEIQILTWAARNGLMNNELCKQVLYICARTKEFSEGLLKLLIRIYRINEDPDVVSAICSMLIREGKTDTEYFEWYSRGVEMELRITKLYEYYMLSIPLDREDLLPKSVIMYFGFKNHMDYIHIAYLYANMLRHRFEVQRLCEEYEPAMREFAIEQIRKGHINRDLAFIYEQVVPADAIEPDIVNDFVRLLFSYDVAVDKGVKNICVVQEEFEGESVYPVENGHAYPDIYSSNYMVFAENERGIRSILPDKNVSRLMNEAAYVPFIKNYVSDNPGFNLYLCSGRRHFITIDDDNVDFCRNLVDSIDIRESFKRDVRMELLRHYYDNNEISTLDEFLINIDPRILNQKDRAELIGYFVIRGMYDEAYDIITIYGAEKVPVKTVVRICSHMISRKEELYDVMLVKVAYHAFINGKYDVMTLQYLVDNFNGLTKELRNLWKAAGQFDLDCDKLMEKLIIQMLTTRTTIGEKNQLFEEYVRKGSNTRIELAYLSYNAYDYFIKERVLDPGVFYHLTKNYRRGEKLNDACKLALLKYYAEDEKVYDDRIKDMLTEFIKEFLQKNIFFVFFREFTSIMPELSVYNDKTIVEYRTDPGVRVLLHYIIEGDEEEESYHTEEMRNMYGGVFSREFILFFGENLQYYITEESAGHEALTFSDSVSISDAVSAGRESRYDLLNDMVVSKTLQDEDTLIQLMEEYVIDECFTDKVFTCI